MMDRRTFLETIALAILAAPPAFEAQQAAKPPTIGFLGAATPSAWADWVAPFVQRLRELGWIAGRNIAIEYRWAEGSGERAAFLAGAGGDGDERVGLTTA